MRQRRQDGRAGERSRTSPRAGGWRGFAARVGGWRGFAARVGGWRGLAARTGGSRRFVARCRDRGSYTAELAAGLPALVLLLVVGLAAVGAVTTKAQCVDTAREAALAAARGESGSAAAAGSAPPGAEISVAVSGDTVVVSVRAQVRAFGAGLPKLTVAASAVAAVEPGTPGPAP